MSWNALEATTDGTKFINITGANFGPSGTKPQVFVRFSVSPAVVRLSHNFIQVSALLSRNLNCFDNRQHSFAQAQIPEGVGRDLLVVLEVTGQTVTSDQRFIYDPPRVDEVSFGM